MFLKKRRDMRAERELKEARERTQAALILREEHAPVPGVEASLEIAKAVLKEERVINSLQRGTPTMDPEVREKLLQPHRARIEALRNPAVKQKLERLLEERNAALQRGAADNLVSEIDTKIDEILFNSKKASKNP